MDLQKKEITLQFYAIVKIKPAVFGKLMSPIIIDTKYKEDREIR